MERTIKRAHFSEELERNRRSYEIYMLYTLQGMKVSEIAKKYGYCREYIHRLIHKFTVDNPKIAEEMALANYPPSAINGLIHHSDRGVQYASYIYTDKLKKYGIKISMTESGDPKDNAVASKILFLNRRHALIQRRDAGYNPVDIDLPDAPEGV